MQKFIKIILMITATSFSLSFFAAEPSSNLVAGSEQFEKVKALLAERVPSLDVEVINESPLPGIYQVFAKGQVLYVSSDAKFLISGKLFSIEHGVRDLTESALRLLDTRLSPIRRETLSKVPESDMVIFKADDEKYKITVFTDVDCAYCRKLHKEMPNYNKLGITIRYMGYPRAGLGSPSHVKLQSIWCAKDKKEAMNRAKIDRTFGSDSCDNPLAEHYQMVQDFRLNGTPAIILTSGQYLPGFAKAPHLLEIIKEDAEAFAKLNEEKSIAQGE